MESRERSRGAAARLLVVEDHPVVRQGISAVLSRQPGLEVAAQAASGEEALRVIDEVHPDVILMDVDLPGMSGLEVAERVWREKQCAKVILLTAQRGAELVRRAKAAGVSAFLPKESPIEGIVAAVEEVAAGRTIPFGEERAAKFGNELDTLTDRERDVLMQVASGLRSHEIGSKLGIPEEAVGVHRAALMRKLDAHSTADLTRIAVAAGLVQV